MTSLYTDGASKGNPGLSGCGYVILEGEVLIDEGFSFLGIKTNNQAEYEGVLLGLSKALKQGILEIEVFSDSELLVKQLKKVYRVKNKGLFPLYQKVVDLSKKFDSVHFTHVRREYNKRADSLANQAILQRKGD